MADRTDTRNRENRPSLLRSPYSRLTPAVVLAAGFLLRLMVASSTYLNPDEALHYFLAHQASLALAYRASLTSVHPPLLILFLYGWRMLGNSEFVLRLPSVISGTLVCYFAFRWVQQVAGPVAALLSLIVISFSPTLVSLDGEIRQYSLLLLFASASLYLLELSLAEHSGWLAFLSSALLCLAILTHYSAIVFALVLGAYALVCFLVEATGWSVVLGWALGQSLAVISCLALYISHGSKLRKANVTQVFADTYLRKSFFHPGQENVLVFALRSSYRFFHYLMSQPIVGAILLLLYLAALARLVTGRVEDLSRSRSRTLAFLLMVPFVITCGFSIAQLYPYGGTRHDIFLALFAVLGVSIGLTHSVGLQKGRKLLGMVALLLVCWIIPKPLGAFITPNNERQALMRKAIDYVGLKVAPESVFLIDQQSVFPFRYYFCRDSVIDFNSLSSDFNLFPCGPYRVLSTGQRFWMFTAKDFLAEMEWAVDAYHLPPGATLWVFQMGWVVNAEPELRAKLRSLGCQPGQNFGQNILVCSLRVSPPKPKLTCPGRMGGLRLLKSSKTLLVDIYDSARPDRSTKSRSAPPQPTERPWWIAAGTESKPDYFADGRTEELITGLGATCGPT